MRNEYKAKPMGSADINCLSAKGGEYQSEHCVLPSVKSTIPAKASVGGSAVDGPYGGKRPA